MKKVSVTCAINRNEGKKTVSDKWAKLKSSDLDIFRVGD